MPDITLPHVPADAAVSSADGISQNLYDPAAVPNSYEVINGRLNNPNRRATWDASTTQIQKNACSGGSSTGSTLGLNYYDNLFQSFDAANTDFSVYEPIPGSSLEFFLPYDPALTILSWSLYTTNNDVPAGSAIHASNIAGQVFLHVDGVRVVAGTTRNMQIPGGVGRSLSRSWAGHVMIDGPGLGGALGKGWHSASLRIATLPGIEICRVGCRSIHHVYFS